MAKELAHLTGDTLTALVIASLERELEAEHEDEGGANHGFRDEVQGRNGTGKPFFAARRSLGRRWVIYLIVDSSAVLAFLLKETDALVFATAMANATITRLSAASYVQVANLRRTKRGCRPTRHAGSLYRRLLGSHRTGYGGTGHARAAGVLFGKSRHKAALNFGDCFTYALAKAYGELLLFKGGDFALTDLEAA